MPIFNLFRTWNALPVVVVQAGNFRVILILKETGSKSCGLCNDAKSYPQSALYG